jgi:hypothetical protein
MYSGSMIASAGGAKQSLTIDVSHEEVPGNFLPAGDDSGQPQSSSFRDEKRDQVFASGMNLE